MKLKDVKIRRKTCLYNDKKQYDLDKSINIYIVANRNCNAKCKFCEFTRECDNLDINKLKETLTRLNNKYKIMIAHITGGEPTLNINKLLNILDTLKNIDKSIYTTLNTNGINLNKLKNIKNLNNVALSRHALTDEENFEIFGSKEIATDKDIISFPKKKLHLSCNLIKGYIDSNKKIENYLNKYGDLGVFDIGFVNLMKVNTYCEDKQVIFDTISVGKRTKNFKNINKNKEIVCECNNYLYTTPNGNIVSFYNRGVTCGKSTETNYLVYENNRLRNGFGGEYIDL